MIYIFALILVSERSFCPDAIRSESFRIYQIRSESFRIDQIRSIVANSDRSGLVELLSQARRARTNLPSRYVRPQDLIEVRIPVPDRKGQIASITMLAADCDVNVADIEVAHSTEGAQGVLVLVVARAEVQRFLAVLAGQGYRPTTRELA